MRTERPEFTEPLLMLAVMLVRSRRRAGSGDNEDSRHPATEDALDDRPLLRIEIPEFQDPADLGYSDALDLELPADLANRLDRVYEEALEHALGDFGEVTGSGPELQAADGELHVELQILLTVSDLGKCLPIIRRVLQEHGAPPDTKIRQYYPNELVFDLSTPSRGP